MAAPPTFVSLFCGCGGLDLGFEQAGFHSLGAFDSDPLAVEIHNKNLRGVGHLADLTSLSASTSVTRRPGVVIAGPPCQGFSTLGKRNSKDPRNSLIVVAAKQALQLTPQVIVIENVLGAVSGPLSRHWIQAERLLRRGGYQIANLRLISSDFGVPQIRRRAILVAWKSKGSSQLIIETLPRRSLKDTLSELSKAVNHEPHELRTGTKEFRIATRIKPNQKLCNVRGGGRAVPTWDIPEVFGSTTQKQRQVLISIQRLRRQLRLRELGDADPVLSKDVSNACGRDVANDIRQLLSKSYLRRIGRRLDLAHTFNGKYRRLDWEELAPAVDTRFGEPRYFLHPEEQRGFSVREAARIQGFPDSFIFSGSRVSQFRMVGNAVPPPLAMQLAFAIQRHLL